MTKIAVISTKDRVYGVNKSFELLGINPVKDKNVVFKPKLMTQDTLLTKTAELNDNWHTYSQSIKRVFRTINFGFYSFTEALSIEIYWKLLKWSSSKNVWT